MRTLARALSATFKPAAPKRPDTQRKAREEAKRLAAEHGVELEQFKAADGGGMNVWPPKGYKLADPYEGDHYARDWSEALTMVKLYAGLLPNENLET